MLPPDSPALRVITDPEAVASLASDRQPWGDLWQAIAREADADQLDDHRDDDEKATAEDSAAA